MEKYSERYTEIVDEFTKEMYDIFKDITEELSQIGSTTLSSLQQLEELEEAYKEDLDYEEMLETFEYVDNYISANRKGEK